jgi:hypothetical protein
VNGTDSADLPFPPELASETMARLFESQGRPDKAAAVRALLAGEAHVEAVARDGRIEIAWRIRSAGPLSLRVVRFAPGDGTPDTRDIPVDGPTGAVELPGPSGWVCVAIGHPEGDRFVPLAHAPPLRVDAGRGPG